MIATGNEIVPPDVTPKPGQVRSINQYALRAMIAAEGGVAIDLGVIPDRIAAITRAVTRALRIADVVMLSGGSSVGTKDLTPRVIRTLPRARILVHGVRIKPGKPMLIAQVGATPVLGLPGHPVSALVVFEIFGAPLVRRLGGEPEAQAFTPRAWVPARLPARARRLGAGAPRSARRRMARASARRWLGRNRELRACRRHDPCSGRDGRARYRHGGRRAAFSLIGTADPAPGRDATEKLV